MFSKSIRHPFFTTLSKGLFGYKGTLDLPDAKGVEVAIKSRAVSGLEFAVEELHDLGDALAGILALATADAFEGYEIIKDDYGIYIAGRKYVHSGVSV